MKVGLDSEFGLGNRSVRIYGLGAFSILQHMLRRGGQPCESPTCPKSQNLNCYPRCATTASKSWGKPLEALENVQA